MKKSNVKRERNISTDTVIYRGKEIDKKGFVVDKFVVSIKNKGALVKICSFAAFDLA